MFLFIYLGLQQLQYIFALLSFERILPKYLPDYELIDSGGFEKLERFGKYITRRPEPQAIWEKSLSDAEWQKLAHASFERKSDKDQDTGKWTLKPGMPDRWMVEYKSPALNFKMRLALTSFKHVGIFPEQADNWEFIANNIKRIKAETDEKPRILNLFAYTGGASLAACAAGADTTHVDSVKQVITWSRENMESSGLDGIRWLVEDAFKFVQREARRGKKYHGIILDPPAYGRGPDGEKWLLEKQLYELLELCNTLLLPKNSFLILNLYSMGYSATIAETLVAQIFKQKEYQIGENYLEDKHKKRLPLGIFLRFSR